MNDLERDTILAALRTWQGHRPNVENTDSDLWKIATNDGEHEAMPYEEIGDLCERLNTAPERTEGCRGCYPTLDEPDIDWCCTCRPIPPCTCEADHGGLFWCPCYVPDEEKQPTPAAPATPGE